MRPIHVFVASIALIAFVPAHAADTGIEGTKLQLKSRGATQKLVFVSKDTSTPFPPIGSADDPSAGGLMIELITQVANGAMSAPEGVGNPGWKVQDGSVDAYTYRNAAAPGAPSPVRSLVLKQGRVLKIIARIVPIEMTAPLGPVGIRITMGSTRACALFDASTIVADAPGTFNARNATARPVDCATVTLGGPPSCGDGVVSSGEQCEPANDAACPGQCLPECECAVPCDDGELDPGEECDGAAFSAADACVAEPGFASPRCTAECTCCQTLVCSGSGFELPCCPGLACPPRLGPHDVAFCRPSCDGNEDCDPGQFCLASFCRTPTCTSDAECPDTLFGPSTCLGVCCVEWTFGLLCQN